MRDWTSGPHLQGALKGTYTGRLIDVICEPSTTSSLWVRTNVWRYKRAGAKLVIYEADSSSHGGSQGNIVVMLRTTQQYYHGNTFNYFD